MVAEKIYDLLTNTLPKFIGDLPSAPNTTVAIMEYSSGVGTEFFGNDASLYQPVVKIVVRTDSYSEGSSWVEEIKEKLHRYHDDFFMSILVVGTPIYLGRDEMKLHEFQVTFKIQIKE